MCIFWVRKERQRTWDTFLYLGESIDRSIRVTFDFSIYKVSNLFGCELHSYMFYTI